MKANLHHPPELPDVLAEFLNADRDRLNGWRRFASFLGREPEADDFNRELLYRFHEWLEVSGYAAGTINGTLVTVRKAWRVAHAAGLAGQPPALGTSHSRRPEATQLEAAPPRQTDRRAGRRAPNARPGQHPC